MYVNEFINNFEKNTNLNMKRKQNRLSLKVSTLALFMCLNMPTRAQNENTQDSCWKFSHPLWVEQPKPTLPNAFNNNVLPPEFPGGQFKLKQYLEKETNIVLSKETNKQHGKVIVGFIVSGKGKLSDFRIIKSTNSYFNKKALNIVKSMPDWIPAQENGKNVKSRMNVILNFK